MKVNKGDTLIIPYVDTLFVKDLIEVCVKLKELADVSVVYVITDNRWFLSGLLKAIEDVPLIVATTKPAFYKSLVKRGIKARKIKSHSNLLAGLKHQLVEVYAEGLIRSSDKVLCVLENEITGLVTYDIRKTDIAELERIRGIKRDVIEGIIDLGFELIKEGREGRNVGTLFVVGDVDAVMSKSRQGIINPYQGHPREARSILDRGNWETIKELAQLDGGFVIDTEGDIVSAGRYFNVDWSMDITSGLGGRHMAGISVTKATKAIAVVVSESGTLTVFRNGKPILKV